MDYGVTDKGFNRKPREQIVSDLQERARANFGSDINLNDNSPLGIMIKILSFPISLTWGLLEAVYNSAYINTATGISLDYIAQYIGIERQEATKAKGNVDFYGDVGTTIPEGFLVETDSDEPIRFETTNSGDIQSDGKVNLDVICTEVGTQGNVAPKTITVAVNPISGLDRIENPFEITGGTGIENDYELRRRYKDSVSLPGSATIGSITAAIRDLDNVENAVLKENYTMSVDSDGLPPKSFEAIVLGGNDDEVAETILQSKAVGIETHGDISITKTDVGGQDHLISFSRPAEVPVFVDITVTTDAAYPEAGNTEIINEVIKYVGGVDTNGKLWTGLNIGESVIHAKLIDVVYNIEGVQDVEINLGLSDNPTGISNIEIGDYEVAETSASNVDVFS